ncbi:hypothetical protein V8G54_002084 [Vigna mungo]|uniref:Uncharacterized protein n=1 Tax=Vigna mungo TaxID=3915 RepID=A0AAQ3P9L6_VIGMU
MAKAHSILPLWFWQYAIITRLEISFAVIKVCQFLRPSHWILTGLWLNTFYSILKHASLAKLIGHVILIIDILLQEQPTFLHKGWVQKFGSNFYLIKNLVLHSRAKHMQIGVFFVMEKIMAKQLFIYHILVLDQWGDVLTRP